MSKKVVRYFFGFIESQQKWLNSMARNGYRLIATGKLIYEFELVVWQSNLSPLW